MFGKFRFWEKEIDFVYIVDLILINRLYINH